MQQRVAKDFASNCNPSINNKRIRSKDESKSVQRILLDKVSQRIWQSPIVNLDFDTKDKCDDHSDKWKLNLCFARIRQIAKDLTFAIIITINTILIELEQLDGSETL